MKLKTLLFSGMIATMIATPVLAYSGGHSYYTNKGEGRMTTMCSFGGDPEHAVALMVTQNRNANQTYAESQCTRSKAGVGTKVMIDGTNIAPELHDFEQVRVTANAYGIYTCSEVHRIDYMKP